MAEWRHCIGLAKQTGTNFNECGNHSDFFLGLNNLSLLNRSSKDACITSAAEYDAMGIR